MEDWSYWLRVALVMAAMALTFAGLTAFVLSRYPRRVEGDTEPVRALSRQQTIGVSLLVAGVAVAFIAFGLRQWWM